MGFYFSLFESKYIDAFIENVQKIYTQKIGHDAGFFKCVPADGVSRI